MPPLGFNDPEKGIAMRQKGKRKFESSLALFFVCAGIFIGTRQLRSLLASANTKTDQPDAKHQEAAIVESASQTSSPDVIAKHDALPKKNVFCRIGLWTIAHRAGIACFIVLTALTAGVACFVWGRTVNVDMSGCEDHWRLGG